MGPEDVTGQGWTPVRYPKIQARHWKRLSFEKMAGYTKLSEPSEAEETVKKLVVAISEMEDIVTLSSCGGHKNPDEEHGMVPKGDFFVMFFVKPTRKGFRSLGTIVDAASNIDRENVLVKVDNMTDNPDFIFFELCGTKGVSPDTLAEEITSLYGIFKQPPDMWPFLSKEYQDIISGEET